MTITQPLRTRRTHSEAFKQSLIEACSEPGASVAGVALANGICSGLISPDTSIGATHLDEEYEQERTKDIQRGVQAAGRADDSCAGLERRRR